MGGPNIVQAALVKAWFYFSFQWKMSDLIQKDMDAMRRGCGAEHSSSKHHPIQRRSSSKCDALFEAFMSKKKKMFILV